VDDLLDRLNPPQRQAVQATEGPLLVIAGAGSGKTRVIAHRIAYLIERMNVAPSRIFAATFTNKAAKEMKARVVALLERPRPDLAVAPVPVDELDNLDWGSDAPAIQPRATLTRHIDVWSLSIATFHSLCVNILRRQAPRLGMAKNFLIADERDALTCMREALAELNIPKEDLQPSQALWAVSQCKLRLLPPDRIGEVVTTGIEDTYRQAFIGYQEKLQRSEAMDFDDLIGKSVELFETCPDVLDEYRHRFQYLLVDEYQDTNASQFRLVSLLAGGHRNLCVVGDEDQSIYSWRGADLSNLLEFQKHYPEAKLVKLEQNYRSTGNILAAATLTIRHNTERIGKTLWTAGGDGLPIGMLEAPDDRNESTRIARMIQRVIRTTPYKYSDIAIFYRANSLSRSYEEGLRAHEIPYHVVGGVRFYDRQEVRDLLSYLQLVINPNADLALDRIINVPARGIGAKTKVALVEAARKNRRSMFQQIGTEAEGNDETTVTKGKTRAALSLLLNQWQGWLETSVGGKPVDVLDRILNDTSYVGSLGDPNSLEVRGRIENIDQLRGALTQWSDDGNEGGLAQWMESIALAAATDAEEPKNSVAMMTLHAAKGLEFPVVFLAGLEEGVFPNRRAAEAAGSVEEERRLFYVGITRAKRCLIITRSDTRLLHGDLKWNPPSPFLSEIDLERTVTAEQLKLEDIEKAFETGSRGRRESLEAMSAAPKREERPPLRTPEERGWNPINKAQSALRDDPRPSAPNPAYGRAVGLPPAKRPTVRLGRSSASEPPRWAREGARVSHQTLGEGTIVKVSGQGSDQRVLAQFEDDGRSYEFVVQYAALVGIE